jgi:hypothetical protein
MRAILFILALLLSAPAPALAQAREIRSGENVVLRPDRAYLLFRAVRPPGVPAIQPVFLRIPTDAELAQYDEAKRSAFAAAEPELVRRWETQVERAARRPAGGEGPPAAAPPRPSLATFNFVYTGIYNLVSMDSGRAFVRGQPETIYLLEVMPGDYVFYGLNWGAGIHVCMCLGTVGFAAAPGIVTDMGYLLADRVDRVSAIPELRAESGFGPGANAELAYTGATVRLPRSDTSVPEMLRSFEIRPAAYRAVGRFVEPHALSINRLAPVPGILDYDGGHVLDAATGQEVPDVN